MRSILPILILLTLSARSFCINDNTKLKMKLKQLQDQKVPVTIQNNSNPQSVFENPVLKSSQFPGAGLKRGGGGKRQKRKKIDYSADGVGVVEISSRP